MKAQVTFAGNGHAEGTVAEHLDPHKLSARSADVVADNSFMDGPDLIEIQFTGQDHHVGITGIEAEGLGVGDAQLGGDVDLHPPGAGIEDCGHVGGDYGRDAARSYGVDDGAHLLHIPVINDGVYGEVGLDSLLVADGGDAAQVVQGKVDAGAGTHIKPLDSEIYGVGTGVDCRPEAFIAPHGSHYLKILSVHCSEG